MGRAIRGDAPVQDIIADARLTRARAMQRGGLWDSLTHQFLDDVLAVIGRISAALTGATSDQTSAAVQRDSVAREAHIQVGGYYYELWQHLGRPAYDLRLNLMFPEGATSCTSCPVEDQPDRMRLLAELLSDHIHPRLPASRCDEIATELRTLAERLSTAHAAFVRARSRKSHYETLLRPICVVTKTQMANLKRALLAHDFRQTEIHEVIPAHARPSRPSRKAPAQSASEPKPAVPPAPPVEEVSDEEVSDEEVSDEVSDGEPSGEAPSGEAPSGEVPPEEPSS